MKDLKNPTILGHNDLKNIKGGQESYSIHCTFNYSNGLPMAQFQFTNWFDAMTAEMNCNCNAICSQFGGVS